MNRRASRIGLYAGSVLLFLACVGLYLQLRLNQAGDRVSVRDRAEMHAQIERGARDREALRSAVLAFVRQSKERHDETQRMLRSIADRLDRIERDLAAQRQP